MIIFEGKVNLLTAVAICEDGLADHLGAVNLQRSFDNQMPTMFKGLSSFDVSNEGVVIAAKHRFELSKYLKTNGHNTVTCNSAIAIAKGAYYGDVGGMVKRGVLKKVSGLLATGVNIRTMAKGTGVFATTASVKHMLTGRGAANGFFIMVFPAAWLNGRGLDATVFMLPNNVTTFASLASMAGPSFRGIKDQSGKAEGLDWFHVQKRRNVKAQQYANELLEQQMN